VFEATEGGFEENPSVSWGSRSPGAAASHFRRLRRPFRLHPSSFMLHPYRSAILHPYVRRARIDAHVELGKK
jgi:hypothetical protein